MPGKAGIAGCVSMTTKSKKVLAVLQSMEPGEEFTCSDIARELSHFNRGCITSNFISNFLKRCKIIEMTGNYKKGTRIYRIL